MKKYTIIIKGNDIFEHERNSDQDDFDGAVSRAKKLLEDFKGSTIEQLRIVSIAEL